MSASKRSILKLNHISVFIALANNHRRLLNIQPYDNTTLYKAVQALLAGLALFS